MARPADVSGPMHPAPSGDNPAAPAIRPTRTLASRVPSAAFASVHVLAAAMDALAAKRLPDGAECPERRDVISATRSVGVDLRRAFAVCLADADRAAREAASALDAARETLENAVRNRRDLRDALRDTRETGEVPARPELGDNNTRRWHPVDGWQDGNEAPEVNSPMALALALALADGAALDTRGAHEVKRAALEALAEDEDREDAEREAAHGDGCDD